MTEEESALWKSVLLTRLGRGATVIEAIEDATRALSAFRTQLRGGKPDASE
jgi:hypothetical protein